MDAFKKQFNLDNDKKNNEMKLFDFNFEDFGGFAD